MKVEFFEIADPAGFVHEAAGLHWLGQPLTINCRGTDEQRSRLREQLELIAAGAVPDDPTVTLADVLRSLGLLEPR